MKIGIVIKLSEEQAVGRAPRYSEIRAMAQDAETAGLDSIWLFDHLLFRYEGQPTSGIWECWTTLAALAEATQRVELGTLVLCNPFRNPALLAKMAHTLDEVSGGRLILGLGAGWHRPEFDAFGFPFDHRVDRLEEALQIVRPLLRDGQVDFRGTYYRARSCQIIPRSPRAGGPPLLVGAFGPRMLRLAAGYADLWNTAWLGQPGEVAEPLAEVRRACAEVGRDPATLGITAGAQVIYPDLGDVEPWTREPLSGTAVEVAQGLAGYERAGVDHLILLISPNSRRALDSLAEAVRHYRG